MRLFIWLAGVVGLIAIAAWATRPALPAFEALLKTELQARIATSDIGTEGDPLATLALLGCKLRPSDCYDLVRDNLDIQIEERAFFTRFRIKGFRRETSCTGAFTRIWCVKPILAP